MAKINDLLWGIDNLTEEDRTRLFRIVIKRYKNDR